MKDFNADHSIQLWWRSTTNAHIRKKYKRAARQPTATSLLTPSTSVPVSEGEDDDNTYSDCSTESSENLPLDDWKLDS